MRILSKDGKILTKDGLILSLNDSDEINTYLDTQSNAISNLDSKTADVEDKLNEMIQKLESQGITVTTEDK